MKAQDLYIENYGVTEKVSARLRRPFLRMRRKVITSGMHHVLIEFNGKFYSIPTPNSCPSETSLRRICRQLKGKCHGIIYYRSVEGQND